MVAFMSPKASDTIATSLCSSPSSVRTPVAESNEIEADMRSRFSSASMASDRLRRLAADRRDLLGLANTEVVDETMANLHSYPAFLVVSEPSNTLASACGYPKNCACGQMCHINGDDFLGRVKTCRVATGRLNLEISLSSWRSLSSAVGLFSFGTSSCGDRLP